MELPAAVRATEGAAEPHASGPASAGLRSRRLLVVDDHADTADVLGQLLTLSGHDVRTAGSGQEALQLVDDHVFDVLVSDLGLPDMTGYELMRRIAEIRPIKGIAISGYGMEEDIERSREAGFGDHLVKPVTLPRVEQALRRLTSNPSGA
jgi:CheY-like chemotaxis protein